MYLKIVAKFLWYKRRTCLYRKINKFRLVTVFLLHTTSSLMTASITVLACCILFLTYFLHYLRCECIILFSPQIIGIQVEHSDHEGQKDQNEDHHEFEDVFYSPSQRDLQWSEALIGWKDIRNSRETQNHRNGIQPFRNQLWIWWQPEETS